MRALEQKWHRIFILPLLGVVPSSFFERNTYYNLFFCSSNPDMQRILIGRYTWSLNKTKPLFCFCYSLVWILYSRIITFAFLRIMTSLKSGTLHHYFIHHKQIKSIWPNCIFFAPQIMWKIFMMLEVTLPKHI